MLNVILCGAPGSGKGTQSDKIVAKYGLDHLSTGDALRKEIASGSELGKELEAIISVGQLVPDEKMIALIESYLDSRTADCKGIIFDGFPRTVAQAEALTELLEQRGKSAVLLEMLVEEEEVVARLLSRGLTSGRSDDNEPTIRKRLAVYHEQTQPVAEYYKQNGNHYTIDGNRTMEETFDQIDAILSAL